jgi:hypothetical protein
MVGFPLAVAFFGGTIGWIIGLGFTTGALVSGFLAFLFVLVAGIAVIGRRTIGWWLPLGIVAMIVYFIIKSTG